MGALQLTAVLVLHASPFQMGLLAALRVAPGMVFGLAAGVWADRLRRRPILIAADLCRAGLMGSIPIVYLFGDLRIEHLYVVAFVSGAMTIFFDTAYRSYLPSLVPRKQLIEANSKLSASDAVVEVTAFSAGGWIAQLVSAIATAAVDAVSFLVSGAAIALIGRREPAVESTSESTGIRRDAADGLRLVWRDPILRPIAGSAAAVGFAFGGVGAIILLFGVRDLGLSPGVLGTIFAVGGISSIIGAVYTERLTRRFGLGPTMVAGLAIFSLSMFLIPAAGGPLIVAGAILVTQQLADGAMLVHEVNQMSLRQAISPDRMLGRVNANIRMTELGAMLAGSLVAGLLGEIIGLRLTLVALTGAALLGASWLWASPVRLLREIPSRGLGT